MEYKVISKRYLVEDGISYIPGDEIKSMDLGRARDQEAIHNVEIQYDFSDEIEEEELKIAEPVKLVEGGEQDGVSDKE